MYFEDKDFCLDNVKDWLELTIESPTHSKKLTIANGQEGDVTISDKSHNEIGIQSKISKNICWGDTGGSVTFVNCGKLNLFWNLNNWAKLILGFRNFLFLTFSFQGTVNPIFLVKQLSAFLLVWSNVYSFIPCFLGFFLEWANFKNI